MIILYSQPTCPQCRMIHTLMDNKGLKYLECQDMTEMERLGIRHTPALGIPAADKTSEMQILYGKDLMTYINKQGVSTTYD